MNCNCIYYSYLYHGCRKFKCVPLQKDCEQCSYRISSLDQYEIQDHDLFKINQIKFKLKNRSMLLPTIDSFIDPFLTCFKIIKYPDTEKRNKIKFNLFNVSKNEYPFEIFELPYTLLSEFVETLEEKGYSPDFLTKYRDYIVQEA